jgi:heme/copper-type cytochrome/quinol oxidase subunit 2
MILSVVLGIVFILLVIWLTCISYLFKAQLSNMVGMVVSMSLGMIIGLSVGTFTATLYPASFFEVTVISMTIGAFLGVIAGFPFSLLAIIDGFISGVMGGMMGTMLGVMVSAEKVNHLLNIMSLLTLGTFFFIFLLVVYEVNKTTPTKHLLLRPFSYFALVCVFIFSFHFYSIDVHPTPSHHTSHAHSKEITVTANEFLFGPDQIHLPANQEVTLTLVNDGMVEHDFEIRGLGHHLHAMPGASDSMSVTISEPGSYEVYCTLPGHEEAGMKAEILVTSP